MAFPKCRVCGVDVRPHKDFCPACEQGYDACTADVIALLASVTSASLAADLIALGDHVGAAKKAKEK